MGNDENAAGIAQAIRSLLATMTLLLLALGLVLPVATLDAPPSFHATESVATLWQEAIDEGFTDGGGAATVLQGLLLLVVTIAALTAAWSAALMFGGDTGPRGTAVARVASLVLLLGATAMGFNAHRLAELAAEWNSRDDTTVVAGAGVWWLLGAAVVFASATLPGSVRALWSSAGAVGGD